MFHFQKKALSRKKLIQPAALLLAIAISVLVFIYRDQMAQLSTLGYLGLFLISILGNATIIFPAPVLLTAFLGGGVFNPLIVGLITALGATIGELTGYLAGIGGRAVIKDRVQFSKIKYWMEKRGLATIFVLAVIPNPLFDLAGIASGALRLPVWKFFLATFLGKTVKFISFSYLGTGSFGLIE